jgi:chromosome partitioning protein
MAHVITLANHKGGVGKTTGTANIGAALAQAGYRVLLIDADPQANLGETFGLDDDRAPGLRLEDILDKPAWDHAPAAWSHRVDENGTTVPLAGGVHLIPCTDALADTAAELGQQPGSESRLRAVVELLGEDYDWVLIDTPPGLGVLSSMAMLAADSVIVPARPADFDISGAVKVADLLEEDIRRWNPDVQLLGVLVGQVDRRWNLAHDTRLTLRAVDIDMLDLMVPFAVRVGSAPRHSAPTVVLEPDSRVGRAYTRLAATLADRLAVPIGATA